MGKTSDKLSEAGFFLKKIEANYFNHLAFNYYLSAFISSARSVLWIMRSEYASCAGWEGWYKSLEPTTYDEALLQKINNARIRTEKQAPIKTNYHVSLTIPKEHLTEKLRKDLENFIGKNIKGTVSLYNGKESLTDLPKKNDELRFIGKIDSTYRVLEELGDEDVLKVCREYFETIKNIVVECENRFNQ